MPLEVQLDTLPTTIPMDTMINGLYGYFFGATDESSADTANQENRDVQKPSTKAEEAEWILVDGMFGV